MSEYDYWNAALKGESPAAFVDTPMAGFYRLKRNGSWLPVAVWPKRNGLDGPARLGFKIGAEVVGPNMGAELWTGYCANPITEEVYRGVERGEGWPDADPTVAQMIAQNKPIAIREKSDLPEGFGADVVHSPEGAAAHVIPGTPTFADMPAADPTAEFREQIETALGGVKAYAKIESDEADVRALSLRNMLNELGAGAEKAGKAEYEPMFREYKRIYDLWVSLAKKARDGAGKIKAARDVWADDKMAAAKQATQRAQEAEQEAMVAGKPPEPTPPSNLPPPTPQVRPTYGKASATSTKMVVTEVDYDKFFAALKTRPEWPTVKAQFDEWAQKLANKGVIPDGVKASERANTR